LHGYTNSIARIAQNSATIGFTPAGLICRWATIQAAGKIAMRLGKDLFAEPDLLLLDEPTNPT